MGWLPWPSAIKDGPKLDKQLQEFLDDEMSQTKTPSPDGDQLSGRSTPPTVPPTHDRQPQSTAAPLQQQQPPTVVPPESAFQDGRYAHLWKTYRPVAETEAEAQDHSSRLHQLSHYHKSREQRIGEAAKENCVFEAEALANCYKAGKTTDLLTMCMAASTAKTSCVEMQTKFLRALGYLASPGQDGDVQDRLQVHADLMYRRMVEHEKEIEAAVAAGRPAPAMEPVMSRKNVAAVLRAALGEQSSSPSSPSSSSPSSTGQQGTAKPLPFEQVLEMDPKQKAVYEAAIKDKTAEQVALIQREIEGESIFRLNGTRQLRSYLDVERDERAARTAAGKQRFGDYLLNWWGYNPPPDGSE